MFLLWRQFHILKKFLLFIFLCFALSSYGNECEKDFSERNNHNPPKPSLIRTIKDLRLKLINEIKTIPKPSYAFNEFKAKRGDSHAQYNLGLRYYLGEGVKKDDEEAIYWAEKSANQGHPPAQYFLGRLFRDQQDFEQAIFWIRKYAGSQGIEEAKHDLENMEYILFILNSMYKIVGVEKDNKQAFSLLEQLAHQGNLPAQYLLSVMYHTGVGVKENLIQAYKWSLLAKHNDQDIPESDLPILYNNEKSELIKEIEMIISDIADKLTQDQIAEAQKLVDEFKPQQ